MLTKSENCNPNYLAKICKIEELYPIEGADNLLRTNIGGYDMVVSKDMQIGDVVVYPYFKKIPASDSSFFPASISWAVGS